jgi:hypothetical protein
LREAGQTIFDLPLVQSQNPENKNIKLDESPFPVCWEDIEPTKIFEPSVESKDFFSFVSFGSFEN